MVPLRPLALAATAALLGCATPAPRPATSATPGEAARAAVVTRLEAAAARIGAVHLAPVDGPTLLHAAARGYDPAAPPPPPDRAAARRALAAAVARAQASRPDLDEAALLDLGLTAMADSLGDGTHWIGPGPSRESTGTTPGGARLGGIGVEVKGGHPWPRVVRVLPDAPAARGGLPPGSELRAVDGRSTEGLGPEEVTGLLRGPSGTPVQLEAGPPGGPAHGYRLVRASVSRDAVDCRLLGDDVLHLTVASLGSATARQVKRWSESPAAEAGLVILDLRGNQGGLLEAAGELADLFLEEGTIFSIAERPPKAPEVTRAGKGTSRLEQARVAVLVDEGTGSGAEAVAAALQDARRGTVVGARTAARARIDALFREDGGALRITVATIARADGRPIDGVGVTPDVPVEPGAAVPGPPASDVACPDLASGGPVAWDAAVARAVALLHQR